MHKFKVPTLRNIAQTGPYFHDGHVDNLAEAVKLMAKYQSGTTLTADQAGKVADFLKTLTGEYGGKPLEKVRNLGINSSQSASTGIDARHAYRHYRLKSP